MATVSRAYADMCPPNSQECWGAGFLQESFRLSSQRHTIPIYDAINAADWELRYNITESTLEHLLWRIPLSFQTSYEFTAFVPSTASVNMEDFGTRVVPFGSGVFVYIAASMLAVLVHEALVSRGMRPPFSPRNTSMREVLFCHMYVILQSTLLFSQMAMLVPISLDVALSLKQSAAASGLFLSIGTVAIFIAIPIGKRLVIEDNWDQKAARRWLVKCAFFCVLVSSSQAWFMNVTAQSEQAAFIWWVYLLTTLVVSFVGGLAVIPNMIFWNKVQRAEERTVWMIALQVSRNLGLVLGSFLFLLVKTFATAGGTRLHPRSLLAWIQMCSTFSSILILLLAALALPVALPDQEQVEPTMVNESASFHFEESLETDVVEAGPEELADDPRRRIVWQVIYYSFERTFTISAVEVASIMMLEVLYEWDAYTTGICFTISSTAGIVFALCGMWLMGKGYVRESTCFVVASTIGLVGALFLFDLHELFGVNRVWTLFIADAGIYGSATFASGIAEGWASRAAKDGTDFSIGEYRARNFLAVLAARFLGPIVARALIDVGGRNLYASLQVILCFLCARTVHKACKIVRDFTAFKHASRVAGEQETREASQNLLDPKRLQAEDNLETTCATSSRSTDSSASSRGRSPTASPLKKSPRSSPRSPRQAK
eukprot:TRINITY_DN27388_c0_g1_i1.p1 TRINITY_DN27388_c0_g1~~TRINITY_DN27388_c0_g1_i1.p1  ORF type:complete len:659 (+),score=90.91 TRINITY_DN27388_c0_g1_i1:86-2062(+)